MSRIIEGHLVRHYQGSKGARDAALLDIAQDRAACVRTAVPQYWTSARLGKESPDE